MIDNDFNRQFAEINEGENFTLSGGYRVRLVGYNEDTGLLIVSGHPYGWEVFDRDEHDVFLSWVGTFSGRLYYVKPEDLTLIHGE